MRMFSGFDFSVMKRNSDGLAISGIAESPEYGKIFWARQESSNPVIQITKPGGEVQDVAFPRDKMLALKADLESVVRKDDRDQWRRIRHTKEYPLLKMGKQGKTISLGNGRKLPPLTLEENRFARDLRAAALGGETFREMIACIELAGFRVRPSIFRGKAANEFTLQGFSFTRNGQTMSASRASMRFTEITGQPRAVSLPDDGNFLIGLRVAYDLDHSAEIMARKLLRSDIRNMLAVSETAADLASGLANAKIAVHEAFDVIEEDGSRYQRRVQTMERDGATVSAHDFRNRKLTRAIGMIVRDNNRQTDEIRDDHEVEP